MDDLRAPLSDAKIALYDAFAGTGKALGNGTRLELLDLLAQGDRNVDALARAVGAGVTTTSAHLQVLKRAGLVSSRRDGVQMLYRLSGPDVAHLLALLRRVADAHRAEVTRARNDYLRPDAATHGTRSIDDLVRDLSGDIEASAPPCTVLDVRPREEYLAGHIPGAVSIPVDELAARVSDLPDDAEVVVYCRGEYCAFAYDAVRILADAGRRGVRLADGMLEWRLAEHPVEFGAAS